MFTLASGSELRSFFFFFFNLCRFGISWQSNKFKPLARMIHLKNPIYSVLVNFVPVYNLVRKNGYKDSFLDKINLGRKYVT